MLKLLMMPSATVKRLLVGFLVPLVLLAAVESVARVALTVRRDLQSREADWFIYSPDLGWQRKPMFSGPVGGFVRTFDSAGFYDVDSMQVAASERKVLFLGDSNTFGFGAPTQETFAEVVEHLIPETSSINLGVVGASSYQGRVALKRYLAELDAAAVVVSYNFNDRRYVVKPSEADSPEAFERTWRSSLSFGVGLSRLLSICYLCRAEHWAMEKVGILKVTPAIVDVSTVVPRVGEDHYRDNLVAIIKEARAAGVPVVFLLLRDNPIQTEYLNLGITYLEQGDIIESITVLNAAVDLNNMFSDLARLYLSKAYLAAGQETEARGALMSRVEHSLTGGSPVRLDRDYNRIMVDVASKYAVPVVDGASVLEEHPATFVDFCHFDAYGHRRVGELLAQEVARVLEAGRAN